MDMVNFANNLGKVLIGEHREHQEKVRVFEESYNKEGDNEDHNSTNQSQEFQRD